MAEAKKEEKKSSVKIDIWTMLAEIATIIIVLYLLGAFLANFSSGGSVFSYNTFDSLLSRLGIKGLFDTLVSSFIFFTAVLSMLFVTGIVYTLIRLENIEKDWRKKLYPEELETPIAEAEPKNERWERVVEHISSNNPSDWRLAILECDILLDDVLDQEGFFGNTVGEKLKNAQFSTLNNAWEAHKIRNAIAHEGADFTLTQREARRVVGLYESVFREFKYI